MTLFATLTEPRVTILHWYPRILLLELGFGITLAPIALASVGAEL
jgi:hypothetical protein